MGELLRGKFIESSIGTEILVKRLPQVVAGLLILVLGVTSCAPSAPPETAPPPVRELIEAKVVKVIDGDTIEVDIHGRFYKVRYIGINAPERNEAMFAEAKRKNAELVAGKIVKLEKDVSETDRYGRLLRYVYVDDLFVNAELVRLGYAQVATYPPDVKYQNLFLKLQREARKAKRGLWADR